MTTAYQPGSDRLAGRIAPKEDTDNPIEGFHRITPRPTARNPKQNTRHHFYSIGDLDQFTFNSFFRVILPS
jgi:hypothetical protein